MKKYTQAPLPFQGQKRRFIKQVIETIINLPEDTIFVDLFGGSGLLSHTVKSTKPTAMVIYNDFDNYTQRIANINRTNILLSHIRTIVSDFPKEKKLPIDKCQLIFRCVENEEKKAGYVDYISLSSNLLFSMKYVTDFEQLKKETIYNNLRKSDYNAVGYLEGVEVVRHDYKELFELYKHNNKVIFLVDPPYLSTDTATYSKNNYWRLKDYLDVLDVLNGTNYIYFTSNKSQIVELCEWMGERPALYNPFKDANISTTNNSVNWNASYTDIMLHKINYEIK